MIVIYKGITAGAYAAINTRGESVETLFEATQILSNKYRRSAKSDDLLEYSVTRRPEGLQAERRVPVHRSDKDSGLRNNQKNYLLASFLKNVLARIIVRSDILLQEQ